MGRRNATSLGCFICLGLSLAATTEVIALAAWFGLGPASAFRTAPASGQASWGVGASRTSLFKSGGLRGFAPLAPNHQPEPSEADPAAAVLDRYLVDTDAAAVCNDGTPATFYYKVGDPTLWLVYLQARNQIYLARRLKERMYLCSCLRGT